MDKLNLNGRWQYQRKNGEEAGAATVPGDIYLDLLNDGTIPDPDVVERPFLAVTLAELAPEMMHPGEGRTLGAIAAGFGAEPPGMVKDEQATATLQGLV